MNDRLRGPWSWYFIWHGCPQVARIPTRKALLSAPQVVVCSRKVCGDNHGECRNHMKPSQTSRMSTNDHYTGKTVLLFTFASWALWTHAPVMPVVPGQAFGQKPNDTEWFKLQIAQKMLPKWRQLVPNKNCYEDSVAVARFLKVLYSCCSHESTFLSFFTNDSLHMRPSFLWARNARTIPLV